MRLFRAALAQFVSRQFGTYLLAGSIPTAANFVVGALIRVFSTSRMACDVSVIVGNCVGGVVAFYAHRRITFRVHGEPAGPQAIRFFATAASALVLSVLVAD